jgi:hypothetical protein
MMMSRRSPRNSAVVASLRRKAWTRLAPGALRLLAKRVMPSNACAGLALQASAHATEPPRTNPKAARASATSARPAWNGLTARPFAAYRSMKDFER